MRRPTSEPTVATWLSKGGGCCRPAGPRTVRDAVLADAREQADDTSHREGSSAGSAKNSAWSAQRKMLHLLTERFTADEKQAEERRGRTARSPAFCNSNAGRRTSGSRRGLAGDAAHARDDFLGLVSHDLRTVLGNIALNAELLARSRRRRGGTAHMAGPRRSSSPRNT